MNDNKLAAYQTLYGCLITICKLTSPFAPFIAEEIYQNLNSVTSKENHESIHLTDFPAGGKINKELELRMEVAQQVVYLTRSMRAKSNLKVRQPLKKIMVVVENRKRDALIQMKDVILDEVNVKDMVLLESDQAIVNKSAKANFKSLGPKFGKKVQLIATGIKELKSEEITKLDIGEQIQLIINEEEITVLPEDVEIVSSEIKGRVVESEGSVTVAIDTELDSGLIEEGLAREFVNRIQNMRKEAGFDVTDKISIKFTGSKIINNAVQSFTDYVTAETLANKVVNADKLNGGFTQEWKIGEHSCIIQIAKIES
jgi:isoleucyl-tRNA synthetase